MSPQYCVRVPLLGGEAIEKDALAHFPNATGGILMGRWQSPSVARVEVIIGPGPSAEHEPDGFKPDFEWQEKERARMAAASDQTPEYLGEWKTTAGDVAERPRSIDRAPNPGPSPHASWPLRLIATVGEDGNFDVVPYVVRDNELVRAKLEWTYTEVITWF